MYLHQNVGLHVLGDDDTVSFQKHSIAIALKEDAQPFAINVPRRVALPLMDKTKKELRRMEDAGVIMRVEQPTDCCAPMVVVPKKDDVRICVDLTKRK